MPLEDQILFGALVAEVRSRLLHGFVTYTDETTYGSFESYPLQLPEMRYVVEADVASFYEYIDHDRLALELIRLTGERDLVAELLDWLGNWLDTPRDLPQGPAASQALAAIYISPVSRRL